MDADLPSDDYLTSRPAEAYDEYAASAGNGFKPLRVWDAYTRTKSGFGASKQPVKPGWEASGEEGLTEGSFRSRRKRVYPLNIGILCAGLRAIDIDVPNRRQAKRITALAFDMLGRAPRRWRVETGKCLLLYRAAEGEPTKRKAVLGKQAGAIEVLGKGQQFVAYGNHATAKKVGEDVVTTITRDASGADVRLQWDGPGPADGRRDDLPAVTEDQIEAFLSAVVAEYGGRIVGASDPDRQPVQPSGDQDTGLLQEVCARLLNEIGPREIWEDNEAWVKIGAGMKNTFGDAGLPVFEAWNRKDGPDFESADCVKRWHSFGGSGDPVSWGSVIWVAKEVIAARAGETPESADEMVKGWYSAAHSSQPAALHEAMNAIPAVKKLLAVSGPVRQGMDKIRGARRADPAISEPEEAETRPDAPKIAPLTGETDPRVVWSDKAVLRKQAREENDRIAAEGLPVPNIIERYTDLGKVVSDWWIIGMSSGTVMFNKTRRKGYKLSAAKEQWAGSLIAEVNPATGKTSYKHAFDVMLRDTTERLDGMTWDPSQGEVAYPPNSPGDVYANRWLGIFAPFGSDELTDEEAEEIAEPFVEHVNWLFRAEAKLFMQWLAHIIQKPGELPQTSWVHIAPKKGMGRNWIASVMVRVLRGYVAPNQHLDALLGGSYNGGLAGKLLAVVDETTADTDDKSAWTVKARLRTDINPEFRQVNEKFGLQWVERNCMRWLMFSNDFNAVPMDADERRFNFSICEDDPRSNDYYARLYRALQEPRFIAAVFRYLSALSLRGFDAGDRAMDNPARRRVVKALMHPAEQSVKDFVAAVPKDPGLFTMAGLKAYLDGDYDGKTPSDKGLRMMLGRAGCTHVEGRFQHMGKDGKTRQSKSGIWRIAGAAWSHAEIEADGSEALRLAIEANNIASREARDGVVMEFPK